VEGDTSETVNPAPKQDHRRSKKDISKATPSGGESQNNSRTNKQSSSVSPSTLSPSIPPSQPQQTSDINYGRGSKITVLHIAEKPSIADAICKGLSGGSSVDRRSKILPVHEFITNTSFPKAPQASQIRHRVSSVAGHVFSVDFPTKFQSWDSVDPAELFSAPVVKKPTKGSVVKHLQDEARGVDFIVLWSKCEIIIMVCIVHVCVLIVRTVLQWTVIAKVKTSISKYLIVACIS
jgi:DNA topoisomerase-3